MSEAETVSDSYGVGALSSDTLIEAPAIDYGPPSSNGPTPRIGLVGTGGISEYHLRAYRELGYEVVAMVNLDLERAHDRRREFFPEADVYQDYREIVDRDDIDIVDLATHPEQRLEMYRPFLDAGKHILSQKPFVTNLADGHAICDYADERGLKLAVNQNGRWAPHWRYATRVVQKGLLGQLSMAQFSVAWDHSWIKGSPFEDIDSLVLSDFGIHWFDILTVLMGDREPLSVTATRANAVGQSVRPPMLSQVMVEYQDAQASFSFNAATTIGQLDTTLIVGSSGMIHAQGPDLLHQSLSLYQEGGRSTPRLAGNWFASGFQGTMAELVRSIREGDTPFNNASDNLKSLQLCYAAVRSSIEGRPCDPRADGQTLVHQAGIGKEK